MFYFKNQVLHENIKQLMTYLATNIRLLMESHDWKQKDLAARLNVSSQTVSQWLKGMTPGTDKLEKLAEIFSVPVATLYDKPGMEQQVQEQQSLYGASRVIGEMEREIKTLQQYILSLKSEIETHKGTIKHLQKLNEMFMERGQLVGQEG